MAEKVAFKLLENETANQASPVTGIDVATAAFDSGILYLEAAATNPQNATFWFYELHPVTGQVVVGQPFAPNSTSVAPGGSTRIRIDDLPGLSYRLSVATPGGGNSVTVSASFVGVSG